MADEAIMTVKELASFLRCHETTIYRLAKKGEIPYFRVGFDYRFSRTTITKWLEKQSRQ